MLFYSNLFKPIKVSTRNFCNVKNFVRDFFGYLCYSESFRDKLPEEVVEGVAPSVNLGDHLVDVAAEFVDVGLVDG